MFGLEGVGQGCAAIPGFDTVMHRRTWVQQSYVTRSQDIGQRVAYGAAYQFLSIGLRTAITIGSTAILARLLTPADFGYVVMATVVTELAALLGAFGFTNVLIQRRSINRLQLDTVFWISLGIGIVVTGVVGLLSFTTGWLFADPKVGELLRVLSLNFILNSFVAVPWVVLSRLMRFQVDFWIQLVVVVLRTFAAIVFALWGWGMWSLVMGAVVGAVANAVLSFSVVRYWPRLRFHWPVLMSSWRSSSGYLGNTLLYYLNSNLDLLLIGRVLGATHLGYYQNARSLTDEIRGRIAAPIQHILFPAFSALQVDHVAFRGLVMRASRLVAAVVVPIGFGVSANAEYLVRLLYGAQWLPMVPVMTMFGLSAAMRASTAIASPLFNANDRVGLGFKYNVIGTIILMAAVLVTMPSGIETVAAGVAVASIYPLVSMRAAFALIGLRTVDMMSVLAPVVAAAALMWLVTWVAPMIAGSLGYRLDGMSTALRLLLQVVLGAVVYICAVYCLSQPLRNDLRAVVQQWLSMRRKLIS